MGIDEEKKQICGGAAAYRSLQILKYTYIAVHFESRLPRGERPRICTEPKNSEPFWIKKREYRGRVSRLKLGLVSILESRLWRRPQAPAHSRRHKISKSWGP